LLKFVEKLNVIIIACFSYNKKTYKIDDIAWEKTPADSFEKRNGEKITFIKYYKDHYGIDIRHENQPLLVSNPKTKDTNRGDTGPILLIPELSALTGCILY
jgi:aubergine